MKVLDRYTIRSIITVSAVTMLLSSLILLSVDLFGNLDTYLNREASLSLIAHLTLLALPEALLFAIAPSLLFSIAYYLSQSEANNEMLCLTGSGFSYKRIIIPILVLAVCFSLAQGILSEKVAIPAIQQRQQIEDEFFGQRSSHDTRNLIVSDPSGRYLVRATRYSDRDHRLSEALILIMGADGILSQRIDAKSAYYHPDRGHWVLSDVRIQRINEDAGGVVEYFEDEYALPLFSLEPAYFREMSDDIQTMEFFRAVEYLRTIQAVDIERYYPLAVEFAQRFFDSFSPFILALVALTVSYRFKKNVLLFSIISSLIIAVIYYVLQMLTLIIARQGVISATTAMIIPMIVVFMVAFIERQIVRVS
ncbi:MAG TPA: LptF/LptG family permease [Sphaerochaeta sp.]|nr:LptF/LptG family permease [Sphaerochaeta sp.]